MTVKRFYKKFQVIGGQYFQCWYGESDTLRGAKIIAGRNKEYWDNWQGWHIPNIYSIDDCVQFDNGDIVHRADSMPVCC